jgi:hypothetical protein
MPVLCTFCLCSLVRFPKPQVVVYTLLMVPVLYGAAKLLSSPLATGADWSAGVAAIILIPMPPLAFWAYVLISWHRALQKAACGDVKRSKSNLLRTYGSGTIGQSGSSNTQQRGAATLALLGDPTDNPTLIIRDKQPGEEAFEEQVHHGSDSSEEDGELGRAAGGAAAAAAAAAGRPWKARDNSAAGARTEWGLACYFALKPVIVSLLAKHGACLPAGGSPRRPAAVSFLPAGTEEEQANRCGQLRQQLASCLAMPTSLQLRSSTQGSHMCCACFCLLCRPVATQSFTHARQAAEPDAGDQPLHHMQSLPGSAETDDYEEGKQGQRAETMTNSKQLRNRASAYFVA